MLQLFPICNCGVNHEVYVESSFFEKAEARAKAVVQRKRRTVYNYERDPVIAKTALRRANGVCEYCETPARYFKKNGEPIFDPHHVEGIANGDSVWCVAAIHPDCHAAAHRSAIAEQIHQKLVEKLQLMKERLQQILALDKSSDSCYSLKSEEVS